MSGIVEVKSNIPRCSNPVILEVVVDCSIGIGANDGTTPEDKQILHLRQLLIIEGQVGQDTTVYLVELRQSTTPAGRKSADIL